MSNNMLEYMKTYKVANGYVTQIKLLGISTELTFITDDTSNLGKQLEFFLQSALEAQV